VSDDGSEDEEDPGSLGSLGSPGSNSGSGSESGTDGPTPDVPDPRDLDVAARGELPRPPGTAAEWPVLEEVTEHETPFFEAGYDRVERPDGSRGDYYWIDPVDGVTVVALAGEEVVLVEEYRPRQRRTFLTVPGGAVDADEDVRAAARRELREETGFEADSVEYVRSYYPDGWVRHRRHVAVATDLSSGPQELDETEFIAVRTLPVEAAFEAVLDSGAGWGLGPMLVAREAGHL
jgi:ADP-ribose pyrophosphatase